MGRLIDLTGQVFGRLTVLERNPENDNSGYATWVCQCSCGKKAIVRGARLRSGHTQSCGCLKFVDITNQRFGRLVALYPTDKRSSGSIVWHCKCDCGNECDVRLISLTEGNTTSCGCVKSKGEQTVSRLLRERNINFKAQYKRDDCRYSKTNREFVFDFCLLDDENQPLAFIEYNGIQHYEYSGSGWNTKEHFEITQERDNEKYSLCDKLGIPLYIIRYDEDIEEALENILFDKNKKI